MHSLIKFDIFLVCVMTQLCPIKFSKKSFIKSNLILKHADFSPNFFVFFTFSSFRYWTKMQILWCLIYLNMMEKPLKSDRRFAWNCITCSKKVNDSSILTKGTWNARNDNSTNANSHLLNIRENMFEQITPKLKVSCFTLCS